MGEFIQRRQIVHQALLALGCVVHRHDDSRLDLTDHTAGQGRADRLAAAYRDEQNVHIADFVKLLPYDEGDAKLRGGEGIGQRREDIRPAALADTLFNMREGQVEIVEIGTGVHIIRVAQREYAGQIPLNEATQKQIRKKLEGQIIQREYQRIVRELKQRAVIEIEQGS